MLVVAGPDHRGEERDGQQQEGGGEDVGEVNHARMVPKESSRSLRAGETVPKIAAEGLSV